MNDELLNFSNFCNILRISPKSGHNYIRKYRDLPAFKIGHLWRFWKSELYDWIEKQRQVSDKKFRPKGIM